MDMEGAITVVPTLTRIIVLLPATILIILVLHTIMALLIAIAHLISAASMIHTGVMVAAQEVMATTAIQQVMGAIFMATDTVEIFSPMHLLQNWTA